MIETERILIDPLDPKAIKTASVEFPLERQHLCFRTPRRPAAAVFEST